MEHEHNNRPKKIEVRIAVDDGTQYGAEEITRVGITRTAPLDVVDDVTELRKALGDAADAAVSQAETELSAYAALVKAKRANADSKGD